jgi:hypothetical protein
MLSSLRLSCAAAKACMTTSLLSRGTRLAFAILPARRPWALCHFSSPFSMQRNSCQIGYRNWHQMNGEMSGDEITKKWKSKSFALQTFPAGYNGISA